MNNEFDITEYAVDVTVGGIREVANAINERVSIRKNKKITKSVKYMMDLMGYTKEDFDVSTINGILHFESKDNILNPETLTPLIKDILKKELNLMNITDKASDLLSAASGIDVSEENKNIKEDWINQFKEYARLVSDEEMQNMWARVLAGEFENPGSFSLRTLNFLKTISKEEAELFTKVIKCTFGNNNTRYLFVKNDNILKMYDISYHEIIKLSSIGLIDDSGKTHPIISKTQNIYADYDYCYELRNDNDFDVSIPVMVISPIGCEIGRLINDKRKFSDEEFKEIFGLNDKFKLSIYSYGDNQRKSYFTNPLKIID